MILEAVRDSRSHPTADEVYLMVRKRDRKISRGTVYRNLNLLVEDGVIQIIKTSGGNRFDGCTLPHAHLTCTSCGAVTDVGVAPDTSIDEFVEGRTGYAGISHYTIFEGLCRACQLDEEPPQDQPRQTPKRRDM